MTAILWLTALWHFLAFWHFALFPARTLARTTSERPVQTIGVELFRFLGGLNLALVVLALAATTTAVRAPAYACLAVANLSQLAVDLRVRRLGLAHGAFFSQIIVGDALFFVANAAALALSV